MEGRGKLSRAIVLPDPKSETFDADKKEFFKKMGIPENPDGYDLKVDKILEKDKAFMDNFRLNALKSGLTKTQAQGQLDQLALLAKQGMNNVQESRKKAEDGLIPGLKKAMNGDEAEIEKTMNLAKKHLVRYGNKDLMQKIADSMLLYDPAFIMKAADIERALADEKFIDGKGPDRSTVGAKKGAFGTSYSNEFNATYGGKK